MNFNVVNLRALRSGGHGDLFIGQRSDTRESVVVKFLREYHLPYFREAFVREVRILSRKLHGLVPILGSDITGEQPFYVMPFVKGGALSQYAGTLDDRQIEAVATDLARTLANLHAANDVHGDLKPDNILVTQEGQLQVADPLGNGTIFTILFSQNRGGTPGYWAPEIRAGGSISRAGDVHSYGATLYHLLTGRRPQDGQKLDPTSEGYKNAPRIREIIAACCQLDPNARPTMREVLRILNGERWGDIQVERRQRQQFVVSVVAVGLLVLLGRKLIR